MIGVAAQEVAEDRLGAGVLAGLEGALAGPEQRLPGTGARGVAVGHGEERRDGLGVLPGDEPCVGVLEGHLGARLGRRGSECLGAAEGLASTIGLAGRGVGLAQHARGLARIRPARVIGKQAVEGAGGSIVLAALVPQQAQFEERGLHVGAS